MGVSDYSNQTPRGQKMSPQQGHMFYIGLYRENIKMFLPEIRRHRALIFGM